MGRHVAAECPDLDRLVDDACAGVGAAVAAANVPRLAGVVLGGGYGRGEGGVKVTGKREQGTALSNDLDFFAITEEGASGAEIAAIAAALEPISREWTSKLGIDVDFTVRTPWRIRHDERRIMVQELVRGYFDVAGKKGEDLFAGVARRPAEDIPWGEAARLLMNRGMGLLLAREAAGRGLPALPSASGQANDGSRMSDVDRGFVNRNINKCLLGAGDARLVARRGYMWRAVERADALGDALYRAAVEWKFRPGDEPVCDWETARGVWLDAFDEVMEAGRKAHALGRSIREAARWVVRRRTFGELASFGQDCTVRVLRGVARAVRARTQVPTGLRHDWEVFN